MFRQKLINKNINSFTYKFNIRVRVRVIIIIIIFINDNIYINFHINHKKYDDLRSGTGKTGRDFLVLFVRRVEFASLCVPL